MNKHVRTLAVVAVVSALPFNCNGPSPTGSDGPEGPEGSVRNVSNPETGLAPGGVVWTQRSSGTMSGLISVTSGNGLIVVTGNNGVILTSADGANWTLRKTGLDVALNHVIWTGSKFIVVGDSGTILTSSDGTTWSVRNKSPDYHLESVAWNGKTFVTVGGLFIHSGLSTTTILSSVDGEAWTKESGGHGILFGVAWGGIAFLATGYNYNYSTVEDQSTPVTYLSLDGKKWDVVNADVREYNAFTNVIHDGRRFVAVGGSRRLQDPFATLYFTSDFNTWKSASLPTKSTIEGIAFTGSEYIAVGKQGTIIMSGSDGLWKARASGVVADLNGVAATSVGWQLVAVGDGGTLLTSPCGKKVSTASPARHELVGTWKHKEDIIVRANGSESVVSTESLPTIIFSFAEDHSLLLYVLLHSELVQTFEGTWTAKGDQLTISSPAFSGGAARYSLAGTTLTISFPETLDQEAVTRKQVYLRH
jgi:hypothetical protein